MEALDLSILIVAAILTSFLSGVTGMGGGVLLFSLMSFRLSVEQIVPVHGIVQLFSNSFRIYFLRKHLLMHLCLPFFGGAALGAGLAFTVKNWVVVDTRIPLSFIFFIICYSLFKPKKLPSIKLEGQGFSMVGVIAGFLGIFIGTVGPFLAAFYVREDLSKNQVVANKSLMQAFVHVLKVPVFLGLGFNYQDYSLGLLFMIAAVFLGTKLAMLTLEKISEGFFRMLFKTALFLGGLRVLWMLLAPQ